MHKKIIIGSRGSDLALWQANFVLNELKKTGIEAEIKIIKTQGDKVQDLSLDKLEGKGFFTKEIEDALLAKETDLAVHSHKDLPTTSPKELIIAAVSEREDASELIIVNKNAVDTLRKFSFRKNAVVGTSSARRKSQLLAFREDTKIKDIRGNVPTRIDKLKAKEYDAILLAAAGVERLGIDLNEFHVEKLDPYEFVPAPAQGVLALQIRKDDKKLFEILQQLNCKDTQETIAIERKVLNLFDGGCQLPLGVYCEREEDTFKVWTAKAETWNSFPKLIYSESKNPDGLAEAIVKKINNIKPTSVYITKDLRKSDLFLKALTGNGYQVNGRSLIEIKKVVFKRFPPIDWIFFSSKNAIRHFFEQRPEVSGVKFAALGKATAAALRRYDKKADFIGYSVDTKLTGKQFAATARGGIVLFPQAKGGLRTIQMQFQNPKQVVDLSVYETIKKEDAEIPRAEILVFTSPTNVMAYFEKNKIDADQKIVAMGDATANALTQFGIKKYKLPNSFDDIGLVQAVFGI